MGKKTFGNIVEKGENAGNLRFLPFPVFSNSSKREMIISTTSNLSSTNTFNLDQAKTLSFGKELSSFKLVFILSSSSLN